MSCPDEEQLSGFVYRGGAPDIARHLEGCATCRLIVTELFGASSVVASVGAATPERWLKREVRPRAPGEKLLQGRYALTRLIGAGGMGVVYEGHDALLERKVALKLVRAPGPELTQLLLAEARALAKLSHPNVVQIHDVGAASDDEVFLAMELIEGDTVATWLREKRSSAEVLRVFDQAGQGLLAAHEAGLVHGDVKPANLLVGRTGRVVVSDFGLAEAPEPGSPSAPKRVGGTPAYLAPERLRGEPGDARSDQFGFCVTLWEALYGAPPFEGETTVPARLEAIARGTRPPPAGTRVDPAVQRALLRGLAEAPTARHPSMGALLEQLRPKPWWRRRRVVGSVAAAVLVVAVGVGALGWRRAQARAATEAQAIAAVKAIDTFAAEGDYFAATASAEAAEKLASPLGRFDLVGAAKLQRAEILWRQRRSADAMTAGHETVAFAQAHGLDAELGRAWLLLSAVCRYESKVGEANGYVEQARNLATKRGDRLLAVLVRSEEATVMTMNGQLAKGVAEQRECIRELEALLGKEDPITRRAWRRLARDVSTLGAHDEAEAILRKDFELEKRLSGPNHPEVARMAVTLSGYVGRQGRLDEVVALVNEGRRIVEHNRGKASGNLLDGYNNLAAAYTLKGDQAEALKWGLLGLELAERERGREHERTIGLLSNLGSIESTRGNLEKGIAYYRDALDRLASAHRWESRFTVELEVHLAAALLRAGHVEEAELEARRALEMGMRLEEGAVVSSWARAVLGAAFDAKGKHDEALQALAQGHAEMQPQLSPVMRATVEFQYGRLLVEQRRDVKQGLALVQAALERVKAMPDLPPAMADARTWAKRHAASPRGRR